MKDLTVLEQIILSSILCLKENAYGLSIRKKTKKLFGKSIMYGALYNALDQLFRKEFVTKDKRKSALEDGGRNRIYYTLTTRGKKALQAAYELQKSIWANITEVLEDIES